MTSPEEYRIFGPPGTGKTTYLSKKIAGAASMFGSENVLVASFTRTAAAELVGRDLPIGKRQVGTIHSHCYRLLGHPELAESAKYVEEWNSIAAPIHQLGATKVSAIDPWDYAVPRGSWQGDRLLSEMNRLRGARVDPSLWPSRVTAFASAWGRFKEEKELLDFTDLIERAFESGEVPIASAAVGFFDEVQDCTAMEIALVRKWAESLSYVMLAGDDDQCIYQFRGAIPDAFLDPPIDDERKIVLGRSYRLPEAIKALAERWISRVARREEKAFDARPEEGTVLRRPENYETPEGLVDRILEDESAGRDTMVLGSCSFMLRKIIAELRERGVPFHNPYRRDNGSWNPLRGGVSRLARFLDPLPLDEGGLDTPWTWRTLWSWFDPLDAKKANLRRGAKKKLGEIAKDERTADLPVLRDLFVEAAGFDLPCPDPAWLRSRLLASKAGLFDYAFRVLDRRGADALRSDPKVTIGTIHSVKGGEADSVHLLPDLSYAAAEERESGRAGEDAIRRAFYVGMTRARSRLSLYEPVRDDLSVSI